MSGLCFFHKKFRDKTRLMMTDFILNGLSHKEVAEKYGVSLRRASQVCRLTPATVNPGDAPSILRQGVYRGFREIIEPIIVRRGVTWAQIMGRSRLARVSHCRWECWAALHDDGKRYLRIAQFFGRDHNSVMHGIERFRSGGIPYENCHGPQKNAVVAPAQCFETRSGESRDAA